MTFLKRLWIRVRQYPKVAGAALVLLLVGAVWLIARIAGGKKLPVTADDGQLTKAVNFARDTIAQANAQAAVETAAARSKDAVVQQELRETLKVADSTERRKKLADLGNRLRREE